MKLTIKYTRLQICVVMVLLLFFVCFASILSFGSVLAKKGSDLSGDDKEFFNDNRIYYYNSNCVEGYSSSICGDTAKEKYWSALRQHFKEEAAAGILGNIMNEGGFSPTSTEACDELWPYDFKNNSWGNGWTWDRFYNNNCSTVGYHMGCPNPGRPTGVGAFAITSGRSEYLHHINDVAPALLKYFEDPGTYGIGPCSPLWHTSDYPTAGDELLEVIGESDFDGLVELEVAEMYEVLKNRVGEARLEEFNNMGVREAAVFFLVNYERPAGFDTPSVQNTRANSAEKAYEEMKGFVCSGGGSSSKSSSSSAALNTTGTGIDITLVGDSISVQAEKELEARFPGGFLNMVGSRVPAGSGATKCSPNLDGLSVIKAIASGSGTVPKQHWDNSCEQQGVDGSSLKNVIVWELGANEAGANDKKTLETLLGIIGDRKLFLITPYNSVRESSINQIVALYKDFAEEHNNVYIIDWNEAVKGDEAKYIVPEAGMHVHPTDAGKQLLADLIAAAVSGNDDCVQGANPIVTVNGNEYMFPLVGATKENYMDPRKQGEGYYLSMLTCDNYALGACHHTNPDGSGIALDMGLRKKLVDGVEETAADYPDLGSKYGPEYYYSSGVTAMAFVEGELTSYKCYGRAKDGYDSACKCASIGFQGVDGKLYWIGHLSWDDEMKDRVGDTFKLGEKIGVIGPPPCAEGTQSHIHLNIQPATSNDTYIYDIMNAAYEALPESGGGSGSGANNCPEMCKDDNSKAPASLTEEQAQILVDYFNGDRGNIPGEHYDKNCPETAKWFLHYFTDLGFSGDFSSWRLGNGGDAAHNLAEQKENLQEIDEPKPFTVFSTFREGVAVSTNPYTGGLLGHTGLIVGVDGDKLITIESGGKDGRAKVKTEDASTLCKTHYPTCYTYLGDHLNEPELSKALKGEL